MGLRPSRKSVDVEVCVQTSSIQTYQTTNIASANQQAQRWAHVHASNAARQEKRTGKKREKCAKWRERDRQWAWTPWAQSRTGWLAWGGTLGDQPNTPASDGMWHRMLKVQFQFGGCSPPNGIYNKVRYKHRQIQLRVWNEGAYMNGSKVHITFYFK